MRNTKGITLIALVITIIVLLILAGVMIATFTGDNGIITKAEEAARKTRGAELEEYVDLAIAEDTLEDGEATLGDVENILREDGVIDDNKVVWEDDGTTGWLIDKEENIIVEVILEPKSNTEVLYPDDINDFERISIKTSKALNGDEVTISLEVASNKTGTVIIRDNTTSQEKTVNKAGTVTFIATENGTYTFTVTGVDGGTRTVTVVVNEFLNMSDLNTIQFSKNPTTQTTGSVVVTINYDTRAESAIEYRVGTSGSWNSASNPQTVTVTVNNTTIYARYNNGTETAKETSTTVSNIDKEAPNSFNVTTTNITTSSITVSGSTTDSGSGIAGYQFGIAKQGESIVWTSTSSNTTHTFNNLEQNTNYTVVMKAIDKVGLETQAPEVSETTLEVTGAEGNVIITPNIVAATNQNVQVAMSTTTNLIIQYQKNGISGSWVNYTSPVTITENGVIYARLIDTEGQTNNETASMNIVNIDKVAPNSFSLATSNIATESFTVSGSTTDTGSIGTAAQHIGIDRYEVKLLSSTNNIITDWTTIGTATTYNFTGLTEDTGYKVSMRAIDKAGNITEVTNTNTSVTTKIVFKDDGDWDGEINSPNLGTGMTAVAWNSSNTEFTPTTNEEWYDYKDTAVTGANTSKWANAKTSDGSYWVWIPRYEYKLNESAQTIDINFIPVSQTTPTSGYKIHPAFEDGSINGKNNYYMNGEWDKELAGVWVMKYEASRNGSVPKSVPGVTSWTNITIGDMYTYSLSFDSTKGSHLMKNSEWGAVAYLAHSEYGRNGVEVTINNNGATYYTGGGLSEAYKTNVNQNTTGNVTGIYDLSGNAWEYVAGYIPNGHSNLLTYGSPMITSSTDGANANVNGYLSYSTKYVTAYPYNSSTESYEENYNQYAALVNSSYGYGDAVLETSTAGSGSTSWHGDHSYFPASTLPFFFRGGTYGHGSTAGLFSFYRNAGSGASHSSFRAVLAF